ncbi:DUF5685 family protein [Bacillota bacterium]
MLGYVRPDKPELKVREYELYSAYYCGLCRSVKRRYGELQRLVLNYDSVFLALILRALEEKTENIATVRCSLHPLKKRAIVCKDSSIDYAADMMLLLAYFKLQDDRRDEGGLKAAAGIAVLKPTYKKLMKTHKEKCIMIKGKLKELSVLEEEKCASLDRAALPFSELMGEVFAADVLTKDQDTLNLLRSIGYHTGKWIYLIDAYDDLEENAKNGSYNPLLLQWNYKPDQEKMEDFRDRIKERTEFNLLFYLAELSKAWDKLKSNRNSGLAENIIYSGLLRKTEEVLKKGNTEDAESL